jgi:hypothetical protein
MESEPVAPSPVGGDTELSTVLECESLKVLALLPHAAIAIVFATATRMVASH